MASVLSGVMQAARDLFAGAPKRIKDTDKGPFNPRDFDVDGVLNKDLQSRLKALVQRFYQEARFEKIPFVRKWMRNALLFQGYHELEWSEVNVAWHALIRDGADYAFPNNYYRSHVMYGVALYVRNEPEFVFAPANDDHESHACAKAARAAFPVIKDNVGYDELRAREAINLRLFGNSFRYSYYSLDPRYGTVTSPVYGIADIAIDEGQWLCPDGHGGDGQVQTCPVDGLPTELLPPTVVKAPRQVGTVVYPRGQEQCEVVSPLEVYVRSSSPDLWHAPFLIRARQVDRVALQAAYPDVALKGSTHSDADDLSLIYQESLADLPGDPTQAAAWYTRAVGPTTVTFIQAWIRPSQYFYDKQLVRQFPDGLYVALTGDTLLEARNEALDDHWTHLPYNPVPGRFWADGDDDLVPKQLQLNENERLITRNIAYNSVPQLAIDSQRVDKNAFVNDPGEILEVKAAGGRPVRDAFEIIPGAPLPQEVHIWRNDILRDMEYHSGVFGSAIGKHQPGVNTLGGQQLMATRTELNLSPLLLLYKRANEQWVRQMLKIAARNWLDERVDAVMGRSGQWEFARLRGAALDPDRVKITAKIIPVDYVQQQSFSQAVLAGLLNPQDPRVQRKALELYQLPTALDGGFSMDAKVQWQEIEQIKMGVLPQPVLFVHNDQVHIEVLREWLNSDEVRNGPPEWFQLGYAHLQAHILNMTRAASGMAAIQSEVSQPEQRAVPSPQVRQRRARKGAATKPRTSQPRRT